MRSTGGRERRANLGGRREKINKGKVPDPNIDVQGEVVAIIVQMTGIDIERLTPGTRFREELGLDELDFVELILAFEERFAIEIPDEVAERLQTIRDGGRVHPGSRPRIGAIAAMMPATCVPCRAPLPVKAAGLVRALPSRQKLWILSRERGPHLRFSVDVTPPRNFLLTRIATRWYHIFRESMLT